MSIIGLSAEVRVCTALARETGGTYLESLILTHNHYVKSNNLLFRILLLVFLSS